ncbi:hypothetical protein GH714_001399 [Hevea brasiliensis]|uniref:Pex N-terminal domain-containing protein n=1 Tax=Hevea brasiliensis TaxID=3981 RepID=A0A6A6KHN7_HEVBR|nr:hypothetical protein GH714_001399 [Hevea brasiliensis]
MGDGDETFGDADYFDRREGSLVSRGTMDAEATVRSRLTKRLQKIVFACYPWLHATSEGLSFTYQLLYLLDATGFYSLGLHALGIHVCRATGQELVAKEGIPLPPDRTICPLCTEARKSFCSYSIRYNRCPVTLMPATVDQIRRLFHDV